MEIVPYIVTFIHLHNKYLLYCYYIIVVIIIIHIIVIMMMMMMMITIIILLLLLLLLQGPENKGFDVLLQSMKAGINASKELGEFVKERSVQRVVDK